MRKLWRHWFVKDGGIDWLTIALALYSFVSLAAAVGLAKW
jgi:hypothetical protein